MSANFHVVIAAGGTGVRFGAGKPKQMIEWQGKTLLQHALEAFLPFETLGSLVVVCPKNNLAAMQKDLERLSNKLLFVEGGASRAESVKNGVMALSDKSLEDVILVHDAARPFVPARVVEDVVAAVASSGAALPVLPIIDTIKAMDGQNVGKTIDRSSLRAAQTPQGASLKLFLEAYDQIPSLETVTDEAMLLESCAIPVITVKGDVRNRKVTTPEDLVILQALMKESL